MVDLHQVEPGLPDGHPWKTSSRWRMAGRTFFGVSFVGMAGVLFFTWVTGGDGSVNLITTFLPYLFAGVVPLMATVLVLALGPWLTRFYPFSQSLMLGAGAVAFVLLVSAVGSVATSVARGPCPADTLCSGPLDGMIWAAVLYTLPAFLCVSIGFGLAIWSATARGRKFFWPIWAGLFVVFSAALLAAQL